MGSPQKGAMGASAERTPLRRRGGSSAEVLPKGALNTVAECTPLRKRTASAAEVDRRSLAAKRLRGRPADPTTRPEGAIRASAERTPLRKRAAVAAEDAASTLSKPPTSCIPICRNIAVAALRAATAPEATVEMCNVVHQVGVLGGDEYDSKEGRLEQLLERIPVGDDEGDVLIITAPESLASVIAIVDRCRSAAAKRCAFPGAGRRRVPTPCVGSSRSLSAQQLSPGPSAQDGSGRFFPRVDIVSSVARPLDLFEVSAEAAKPVRTSNFRYILNYDIPPTGREYVRRLGAFAGPVSPSIPEHIVYTFIDYKEDFRSRACRELVGLLGRAKRAAAKSRRLGGKAKAAEMEASLLQLDHEEDEQNVEADGEEGEDDDCDCTHCSSGNLVFSSFHMAPTAQRGSSASAKLPVEVVRVTLNALRDLDTHAHLLKPKKPGHGCTLISLHSMYNHMPWEGVEHRFAPAGMTGPVRVVLLLAENTTWHDYPDNHTLNGGGVPWVDILDMESMDRTDALLEALVEHETKLLGGQSERIFLMGLSQGGGQSMLRFLRSKRRLGGWIGSVCHAPTVPHVPRHQDPLLHPGANLDRPMRLLVGEVDHVYPLGMAIRDMERLRKVGGYTDVKVEVQRGLGHHDGGEEAPELSFLCKELPRIYSKVVASK